MPAVDTPSVVPPNVEDVFQGYSFVAPSVLFAENNVISEDLFRPNPDKKPSTSNLVGCKLMVILTFFIFLYFYNFMLLVPFLDVSFNALKFKFQ